MTIDYRKTTLEDHNRGLTSSPFKCYYKGTTVCWQLFFVEADDDDISKVICAVSRKKDAVRMAAYLNSINYDGNGCPIMKFRSYLNSIDDWDTIDKLKEV